MKKVLLIGLLAGLVMLIAGMVVGQAIQMAIPSLMAEYQTPGLFRPWEDPIMSLFFLTPFIMGITLAWVWDKTKSLVTGDSIWSRGAKFGIIFWIASSFVGIFITYSSFPISLAMAASWWISSLAQMVCGGIVFAKMNG